MVSRTDRSSPSPLPTALPSILFMDVVGQDEAAVASLLAQPDRLAILLDSARRTYSAPGLVLADGLSKRWARRAGGPYAGAVEAVAARMGRRGAYLLNYSHEWGCTAGVIEDPEQGGPRLVRTLDWPFDGLGRALIVTRWEGQAGPYISATWPGFAGVLTGSAPGRFATSINHPPLPSAWSRVIAWPEARARVWQSRALPPSHLLRLAFDTCHTFDEAFALLRTTPICIPAIYTLAGTQAGEALVIERMQTAAFIPAQPFAANHWASQPGPEGQPRNASSIGRRAAMESLTPSWTLDWLCRPILQPDTRLVFMATPAHGRFAVQGWEKTGAVTKVLNGTDAA